MNLILKLLVAISLYVQGGQPPQITPPPSGSLNQDVIAPAAMAGAELDASIGLITDTKTVRLRWGWMYQGNYMLSDEWQEFSASIWPTSICVPDGTSDWFLVAGKNPVTGKSEIQKWMIVQFSPLPLPTEPPTPLSYSVRLRSEVIFTSAAASQKSIRFIEPAWGGAEENSHILLHDGDSNSLFRLELSTGILQLVFDSTMVPELASEGWAHLWSGKHPTIGYVYVYSLDSGAGTDTLVLIDSNEDAIPESAHFMTTEAEWAALGLGTPATDWAWVH